MFFIPCTHIKLYWQHSQLTNICTFTVPILFFHVKNFYIVFIHLSCRRQHCLSLNCLLFYDLSSLLNIFFSLHYLLRTELRNYARQIYANYFAAYMRDANQAHTKCTHMIIDFTCGAENKRCVIVFYDNFMQRDWSLIERIIEGI